MGEVDFSCRSYLPSPHPLSRREGLLILSFGERVVSIREPSDGIKWSEFFCTGEPSSR